MATSMKFESPARIALPLRLLPNTIIKTRREHLLQWEARVALFNGIIDERASITGPVESPHLHQLPFPPVTQFPAATPNAPGAARTRHPRLRRPSLYPVELRAQMSGKDNPI